MIYKFKKYQNVDNFVSNAPSSNIDKEYTIINECNGFNIQSNSFNERCFGCLFCVWENPEIMHKFTEYWGNDFISSYSQKAFQGNPIEPPSAKLLLKNPYKNLEFFTKTKETSNIQPWASGIVNHMCKENNRISMEVPVLNPDYDRNGRLDICSITNTTLLTMESKISLEDALKDERFIEQRYKYISEIEKSTNNYIYLTLLGGEETDLLPPNSPHCSGKIGKKTERFYSIVTENYIPFISATALWCLCCRYITYGTDYAWDTFLVETFKNPKCIGLLSAGKIIISEETIHIEPF